MRRLMTVLLGTTLLSVPAMLAATVKKGGKEVEKNAEAAKAAKAQKKPPQKSGDAGFWWDQDRDKQKASKQQKQK